MRSVLRAHEALCQLVIRALLTLALVIDAHRRRLPRGIRRWRGSLWWLLGRSRAPRYLRRAAQTPPHRVTWNRTSDHRERQVVALHVEHPRLSVGQLRLLAGRVLGFHASRDTFKRILVRRRDLLLAATGQARPRQIRMRRRGALWGVDLTQVLILGFLPVKVLGVVDYFGSRLVVFEPIAYASSARVAEVLERAFKTNGAPSRILTDREPKLSSAPMRDMLARFGVAHTLTKPQHPWTNGRIERVFRTFKETVFGLVWLVGSSAQLRVFCADFLQWHNRDRPHAGWGGKTPDEVYFGRPRQLRPLGRVAYFEGRLNWYRFG